MDQDDISCGGDWQKRITPPSGTGDLGPYDSAVQAEAQFETAAQGMPGRVAGDIRNVSGAMLRRMLEYAGVTLTEFEETVVDHLARGDYATVQVVAGWIARARFGAAGE